MKPIKYLDYTVYHEGQIVKSGKVPEIYSLSGVEKHLNLGGVWIWHTCPMCVDLELSNGSITRHNYSDRAPETWFNYCKKSGIAIANPHQN